MRDEKQVKDKKNATETSRHHDKLYTQICLIYSCQSIIRSFDYPPSFLPSYEHFGWHVQVLIMVVLIPL